jgi:hypothetical protein
MTLTTTRAELRQLAARDLLAGTRPADVVEMLTSNGMELDEAQRIVMQLASDARARAVRTGFVRVALGVLLFGGGLVATLLSMGTEGNATLYWGLMLAGVVSAISGAVRMLA